MICDASVDRVTFKLLVYVTGLKNGPGSRIPGKDRCVMFHTPVTF